MEQGIPDFLRRQQMLVGDDALRRIMRMRVIIFGLGGVGSWAVEALARSGVGHITMVDADCVDVTNINRQLPALHGTIGKPKVDVMAERIAAINPACSVRAIRAFYADDNKDSFGLEGYDVVIDAIDTLASKATLILHAADIPGVRLLSSMGAGRRVDPSKVAVAEFWKVKGCPLARALRDRFKRTGVFPRRKFRCVYSDEPPSGEPGSSSVIVTAAFGLRLASLALENAEKQC